MFSCPRMQPNLEQIDTRSRPVHTYAYAFPQNQDERQRRPQKEQGRSNYMDICQFQLIRRVAERASERSQAHTHPHARLGVPVNYLCHCCALELHKNWPKANNADEMTKWPSRTKELDQICKSVAKQTTEEKKKLKKTTPSTMERFALSHSLS